MALSSSRGPAPFGITASGATGKHQRDSRPHHPPAGLEAQHLAGSEGSLREWLETARRRLPLCEAGLNTEIAVTSLEVDLEHRDPADRFLAATTLVFDLELLTVDGRLTRAEWLPTLAG